MGAYAGHVFEVGIRGEVMFRAEMRVPYQETIASDVPPDVTAEERGRHLVHGMIHLQSFIEGGTHELPGDVVAKQSHYEGVSIRAELLGALRRLLVAEKKTGKIHGLDVEGVAGVLGVDPHSISDELIEMELDGLIEPFAQTMGHTLKRGACRLTGTGLAAYKRISEEEERAVPIEDGQPRQSGEVESPRVWISYSHDSAKHEERVLALANELRMVGGIDAQLDKYQDAPPEGWLAWMETMLDWADFVLVVCTDTYHRRATGREAEGVGLGATREAMLINQEIFEAGGRNDRFLAVIFENSDKAHIPSWLRLYTYYDLSDEDELSNLVRRITGQPSVTRPPLGPRPSLPPEEPKILSSLPKDDPSNFDPDLGWHVDLVVVWEEEGGNTRHIIRWDPLTASLSSGEPDSALKGIGGTPAPADFPYHAIAVSYLAANHLRFDFASPLKAVTARHHDGSAVHKHHQKGGGTVSYLAFDLTRF